MTVFAVLTVLAVLESTLRSFFLVLQNTGQRGDRDGFGGYGGYGGFGRDGYPRNRGKDPPPPRFQPY